MRESTEQINQIVNTLIDNSNISVEITQKVSEAFVKQNEKIHDTEEIFRSLNEEIKNTSDAVDGISDCDREWNHISDRVCGAEC